MRVRFKVARVIRASLACAMLPWAVAHAQPHSAGAILSGRVVDANDRPVVSAKVSIEGLISTVTDSLGWFGFANLASETFLIRVQRLGYGLATRVIVFSDTAPMAIEVKLGPRATMLAGVMVMDSVEGDSRDYAPRRQMAAGGFFLPRPTSSSERTRHASRTSLPRCLGCGRSRGS